MDVLSPLDAAFLRLESGDTPMHIASLTVFDGPAPSYDDVVALVESRLPALPRYRQRVHEVPLWLGRPVWADDPRFRLGYHVRRTVLAEPGTRDQLRRVCERLLAQPLRRDRPLWETYLVTGLEDGRWGLLCKVHHCMVDGIAGFDVLTRLLDDTPWPRHPLPESWVPERPPSRLGLLGQAVTQLPRPHPRAVVGALAHPRRTAGDLAAEARGLAHWAAVGVPATASSLTGPVAGRRGWRWASVTLDEVRQVKRAYGGTVNDVVLSLVSGAFRELLLSRGEDPGPHVLRSLVPVSVRARHDDARPAASNHVSAVIAELPVHVDGPVARLEAVRAELDRLKASGEVEAGELVTAAGFVVPPLLLSTGLYSAFRIPQPWLVTVTTNVPGPRERLWCLGRPLREVYPFVPIGDRVRTGIAITSYDGTLTFGVTGDAEHVPDLDVLAKGVEAAMAELLSTL